MNFKNLKIGTQLRLGFGAMLLFVVVLGTVAYRQSRQLHQQTETMYDHPVKTRRATGEITSNFLLMPINVRDYLLDEHPENRREILNKITVNQSGALNVIEKLKGCYLGPSEDIDELNHEFAIWNSILQETFQMESLGKMKEARQLNVPEGPGPKQAVRVLAAFFLSNMSHELRTPLNSVIALTGVLSHRLVQKIPEEEYGYLEVIERNGKHLLSLINDILDISRIEAGHEEIELSEFNANDLISDVIRMVFPEITAAKDSPEELRPTPVKPLILVVEDNPDNMTTAKAILAKNYTVLEALDGVNAVEMARNYKPDLILMDIDLPKMDGIAAFNIIRKDAALLHIPVIAVTASAMVADRETILSHGMDAYISKPIDEKTFFKTINGVLYGK